MDFQNSSFSVNANIQIGIIQKINDADGEFLSYNVFIENYHNEKEFTIGVPIFSFGYNSYTYVPGCRVICLIKDGDYQYRLGSYNEAIKKYNWSLRPSHVYGWTILIRVMNFSS
jgi:hypothetical protein